jgi:hypothetical protein
MVWLALLAACAPIAVESAARIQHGWTPAGDDAMVAVLARDVLSGHSPSHGMPSTLPYHGARVLYHPGPLLFWVYAIPERATGGASAAIVLTSGALQIAAIVAVTLLARRRAGPSAALLALAALALSELALGRDVIESSLNVYVVLLPLAAFLASCWVVSSGDDLGLPLAALFGSLVAQSHFVFVPVVAAVGTASVVAYVVERRGRGERSARLSRFEWSGLTVLVVCWLPVLWDTVVHFPGNVLRSIGSGGSEGGPAVGGVAAARTVVHVLAQYRLWSGALSYRPQALYARTSLGELAVAVAGVAVVLIGARLHRSSRRLAVVVFVALVAAGWTISRLPANPTTLVAPLFPASPRDRFIYVIGASYGALIALSAGAALAAMGPGIRRRLPGPVARAALAAVVVCLAVPASARHRTSPDGAPGVASAIRELGSQLSALDRHRTYVVTDPLATLPIALIVGPVPAFCCERGVLWDLFRRGYDVRVPADDPYLGDVHGPPHGSVDHLWVVDASERPRPNWILVARTRAIQRALDRDIASLRDRIEHAGATSALRSIDTDAGRHFDVGHTVLAHPDLIGFVGCSTTLELVVNDEVDPRGSIASQLCTFEKDRATRRTATVSIYLEPEE